MIISLTGKDTLIINGLIITQQPDADITKVTYPNDKWVAKTGKDGNTIWAYNYMGQQVEVDMRVMLGGSDDQFLQNIMNVVDNNPAAAVLISASFVKNVGDGKGNITPVTYTLSNGVIKRGVDALENADGNTEQSVAPYKLLFSAGTRSIG